MNPNLHFDFSMPRKAVPIVANVPYFITARCVNREWFSLPLPVVWEVMSDYLYLVSHEYELKIQAFVLMANHFHLLAMPTNERLSAAIQYFMRESSKEISRLSGRINQTYGARNYKTLVGGYHHYMNVYKYLYRNPVRAGVCSNVEEYQYSTLNGLLGLRKMVIPVVEDSILFNPEFEQRSLDWLNRAPKSEDEEELRRALRRSIFALKADKNSGKKSELESELL